MPYPEVKTESYSNIGGVNQKASQYQTGLNEVLKCTNLDLTKPGSLTKRPGSLAYAQIGPTFGFTALVSITGNTFIIGTYGYTIANIIPSAILGVYQYSKINGASYQIFAGQGPTFAVLTQGIAIGFTSLGGTLSYYVSPSIPYVFNGSSAVLATGLDLRIVDPWVSGSNLQNVIDPLGISNYVAVFPNNNTALYSFTTFVDYLFYANGSLLQKFDGQTATLFSIPPGIGNVFEPTFASGGASGTGRVVFSAGKYIYSYGYTNERAYSGPGLDTRGTDPFSGDPIGFPVVVPAGSTYTSISISGLTSPILPTLINGVTTYLNPYGLSQMVIYRTPVGQDNFFEIDRVPLTTTTYTDVGMPLGVNQSPATLWFTLAPRFLEIYNNQFFMAGFSSLLSTVYFSAIGEPEGIGATASFEVRTNDGDRITGLKTYYSSLAILKRFSIHQLTGTDPSNFQLNEISDQYGCLSNRAACVYQDKLLFLDRQGIVEFNGANIGIMSNRLEPIFRRMNLTAALDTAMMVHVETRNEIWCAFPIDGATYNNHMVVYDYVANGFYEVEGPEFSYLNLMNGNLLFPAAFNGGYSGLISYFGSSQLGYFPNDNGIGFSCVMQPRFMDGGFGYSVEKQFRRLFLDLDPLGISSTVQVNFRKNEGASIVYGTTMPVGPFQHRIDFGIPGKTISAEVGFYNASLPIRINGWTYHSRFQRDR
jgi:hypothetical protein